MLPRTPAHNQGTTGNRPQRGSRRSRIPPGGPFAFFPARREECGERRRASASAPYSGLNHRNSSGSNVRLASIANIIANAVNSPK